MPPSALRIKVRPHPPPLSLDNQIWERRREPYFISLARRLPKTHLAAAQAAEDAFDKHITEGRLSFPPTWSSTSPRWRESGDVKSAYRHSHPFPFPLSFGKPSRRGEGYPAGSVALPRAGVLCQAFEHRAGLAQTEPAWNPSSMTSSGLPC